MYRHLVNAPIELNTCPEDRRALSPCAARGRGVGRAKLIAAPRAGLLRDNRMLGFWFAMLS